MEPVSFEKFTLSNGLDIILHQDRSLPLVAVNVWYHVGSKDEEQNKTGFAHLFEHIMFSGSGHHDASHFDPLQQVGATLNGSTNTDRTNYWENLPSNYLELALWLEADRMGFLLDALDQRRFDIQRDVVKNERRQSYENRPYGMAGLRLQEAVYPAPHPYHWPTIGYHEDLDAATLDDVRAFFRRFYTPSNASLAIAGDFDLKETRDLAERYFGDLAPGGALPRAHRTDSPLQGHVDLTLYDRVLLPRLYMVWPTVPRFHPDEPALSLLASILGDGKSSRLYQRLVYELRIAQSVSVHQGAEEVAGEFEVEVTAAAGHQPAELEDEVRAQLEQMRRHPPSPEEVDRTKNRIEWRHVRRIANIGGFGGKADRLNSFNVFGGDPGLINGDIDRYLAVQPEDVLRVAQAYLSERQVQLVVLPEPARSYSASAVDRTVQPPAAAPRPFVPALPQRSRLANGLQLLLVEKRELPIVAFSLLLKTGANRDPLTLPGLSSMTTSMLQEGTATSSSRQIAEEFEFMGTQLSVGTGREGTELGVETLSRQWPKALQLVADLVQNPTFPEGELDRVRVQRLTSVRRLQDDATALAGQVMPILLYGKDSPYGHPVVGTEESLEALSQGDLVGFFGQNYGPEEATLTVVGDVSMEEVVKLAEEQFGGWKPASPHADVTGQAIDGRTPGTMAIYLLDKPGAAQSAIRAGHVGAPRHNPDYFALGLLNHLFGGQFTARLNMNLREDKGYSYGYRSWIEWHRHASSLLAGGSVQTEVTREAVQETLREFREVRGNRPVEAEEFNAAKDNLLRQFPSSFEMHGQVLGQLSQIVFFDLPDDYYHAFPANVEAVSLEDVRRVAQERMESERLTVLVVGDRSVVESGLGQLGYPLHLVDHNGRVADAG